jgi:hypothetical protein
MGMTPQEQQMKHKQWVAMVTGFNARACKTTLASIRRTPAGKFRVRIGGKMRGEIKIYDTLESARAAVKRHYRVALLKAVA